MNGGLSLAIARIRHKRLIGSLRKDSDRHNVATVLALFHKYSFSGGLAVFDSGNVHCA